MVTTSWSDLEYIPQLGIASNQHSLDGSPTLPLQLPSFRNTFSADYSEEDMYDDAADQDHIDDEASIVAAAFHDEANVASTDQPSLATSYGYPRNWSDYAEDDRPNAQDDDDDDEVEIVDQPIRAPSVEVVIPPRVESVVVSDDSDRASSYFSEDKVDESPTSSPVGLNDDHNNSDHDSSKAFDSREDDGQEEPASAFPTPFPTHFAVPAETVIMKSHSDSFIPVSSHGSVYEAGPSSILKPIALLHPSDTARAPSPSEVAMVKPTPEVIVQQPFFHGLPAYRGVPSYPLDMPGRDPAWDSPSWDFYDTPHSRLAVVTGGNAGVGDLNQFSIDTPYTRPISQDSHHLAIPTSSVRYSSTPPPPAQATEAVPTPKCSIAQLLEEHKNNDEQGRNGERSLKRKVDETSYSTEVQSFGTHDLATQTKELHSEPLLEENSDIASLPTGYEVNITSTAQSGPEMALDPIDTRPRKKVKTEPSQGGNNDGGSIMKMAAATIVGVAIGTVGTIIGLVALPQDYFL